MPDQIEQLRLKIESHLKIERAAMESWPSDSLPHELHNGRLQAYQEVLTFIDSGGANSS